MTYGEAIDYLDSFTNFERTHQAEAMRQVKLERMRRLCARLGNPQRRFRSVLVAGTNGKGSICAMLYSMLRSAGLRAGLYTSPHLEHLRERLRVGAGPADPGADRIHGQDWIKEEEFAALIGRLRPELEAMRAESAAAAPTYFEIVTAAAFLHFAERGVELAVLEAGLGGRLDATNVVEQAVSIFGPIGEDHLDVLGTSPAEIAREKAGIIKPGQVVLTAPQSVEVLAELRAACDQHAAPLFIVGRDVTVSIRSHSLDGLECLITGFRGVYESVTIPLLGRHQANNAALAVGALEALADTGVPYGVVQRGLAAVEWPGRLEVVHDSPLVLMDGAHNPDAADALRQTLAELCPDRRIHLLVGMSADKSPEEFGRRIGRMAASATCTKSRHPRALDPAQLAGRLWPFCPDVHVTADASDALTCLLNDVPPQDVIVVTGSMFLVGELRSAIRHSHLRPPARVQAEPSAETDEKELPCR
jgi:dihydrofolate synthase/folylpolyglutamate synthase